MDAPSDSNPDEDLLRSLDQALQHLYDIPYLGTHAAQLLTLMQSDAGGEASGWRLHRCLVEAIGAVKPPANAPHSDLVWRRWEILHRSHVDGENPFAVAEALGISRRHYYRERHKALESMAELWKKRWLAQTEASGQASDAGRKGAHEEEPTSLIEEAKRVGLPAGEVAIAPIVMRARDLAQGLTQQRSISITMNVAASVLPVMANPQVLLHMLLAATEALVHLPATEAIHLRAYTRGQNVILAIQAVQDGEPPAMEPDIVEMLRGLAESQSGEVTIERQERALCCRFQLRGISRGTVLVVDDNASIHHLVQRYVQGRGYAVYQATNAQEGLQMAGQLHPDLVIVDLMLPDRDGFWLIERLRTCQETSDIAVVASSILAEPALAASLGADRFLPKPVSQNDLIETLEAFCRGPSY